MTWILGSTWSGAGKEGWIIRAAVPTSTPPLPQDPQATVVTVQANITNPASVAAPSRGRARVNLVASCPSGAAPSSACTSMAGLSGTAAAPAGIEGWSTCPIAADRIESGYARTKAAATDDEQAPSPTSHRSPQPAFGHETVLQQFGGLAPCRAGAALIGGGMTRFRRYAGTSGRRSAGSCKAETKRQTYNWAAPPSTPFASSWR
jgi:hypothetical protein